MAVKTDEEKHPKSVEKVTVFVDKASVDKTRLNGRRSKSSECSPPYEHSSQSVSDALAEAVSVICP